MQKLLTFFSKTINVFAIFNDQSFNGLLTTCKGMFSFAQWGPDFSIKYVVGNHKNRLAEPRLMKTYMYLCLLFCFSGELKFIKS